MSEHPENRDDEPQSEPNDAQVTDPEKVVPADQTAPGLGDVEIGGESLDP